MVKTKQNTLGKDKNFKKAVSQKSTIRGKSNLRTSKNNILDNEMVSQYTHLDVKSFGCIKCNFKCKKLDALARHTIIHVQEPLPLLTCYLCNLCNTKFRKHSRLLLHKITAHEEINSLDECRKLLGPETKYKDSGTLKLSQESEGKPIYKPQHSPDDYKPIVDQKLLQSCVIVLEKCDISQFTKENKHLDKYINSQQKELGYKLDEDCDSHDDENEDYGLDDDINKCFESQSNVLDIDYDHPLKASDGESYSDDHKPYNEDFETILESHIIENSLKKETSANNTSICKHGLEKSKTQKDNDKNYSMKKLSENVKVKDEVNKSIIIRQKSQKNGETQSKIKKEKTRTNNITLKKNSIENKEVQSQSSPVKNMTKRAKENGTKNKIIKKKTRKKQEKKQDFICDICSYQTTRRAVFIMHMIKHSGKQPYSCSQCDFKSCWKNALARHEIIHSGIKPHVCDKCDYQTYQQGGLQRHMKVHSRKKHICTTCTIKFYNETDLKQHKRHCKKDNEKNLEYCKFKCEIQSGLKENFLLKMKSKIQEKKSYVCDTCEYKTSSQFLLTRHFRKHSTDLMLTCHSCKFKCKRSETLERHMQIHTQERIILTSYTCDVCSKKFRSYGRFEVHKNTHTIKQGTETNNAEVFACKLCSYKSKRKHDLTVHMRSHTGEKPFACNFCSHRCSMSGQLVNHMRKHTKEKPYICKICNHRFAQVGSLQKHLKRHIVAES